MKTISLSMRAKLASDATSLATGWKLQLRNGTVMGFTDWTEDFEIDSVVYMSATGYTASAISQRSDLSVPNLHVEGVLESDAISDVDIRAGAYDGAKVWIFICDPNDLPADIVKLRYGRLGQIELRDGQHTTEIRGLAQLLTTQFIEIYTSDCQADFGDLRCKLDLAAFTDTGIVTSVASARRTFEATLSTTRDGGFHDLGLVTWTGGLNNTYQEEVKSFDGSSFTLYVPTGYDITVGDTFSVHAGCRKMLSACKAYGNVVNFRGFPDIPGLDKLFIYPSTV